MAIFKHTEEFKLEGFEEFDKQFALLAEEISVKDTRNALKKAVRSAMKPVLETAKQLAPVDEQGKIPGEHIKTPLRLTAKTPTSRDKKSKYVDKGDTVIGVVSTIHTGVAGLAAIAQEFGSKHHPAQPYLRPALERNTQVVINNLREELAKALEKYKTK